MVVFWFSLNLILRFGLIFSNLLHHNLLLQLPTLPNRRRFILLLLILINNATKIHPNLLQLHLIPPLLLPIHRRIQQLIRTTMPGHIGHRLRLPQKRIPLPLLDLLQYAVMLLR